MLDLDPEATSTLTAYGFDERQFVSLQGRVKSGELGPTTNALTTTVTAPGEDDFSHLPAVGSAERKALYTVGSDAIRQGRVGALILAGGMATRFGGAVKAAVPALDDMTFLELKLRDIQLAAKRSGGHIPVYLMSSFATHEKVQALGERFSSEQTPVFTFPQLINLRMERDASLFLDDHGKPSLYAPGHGDLAEAFQRSGLLDRFQAQGGTTLLMSNVDNLTATLDEAVIGAHLTAGKRITVELAPKWPGDKGGAPAYVGDGAERSLQIVEGFRFPADFDQDSIPYFNTNTLTFDVEALSARHPLQWFYVTKTVDGRTAVQLERLVGELTAYEPTAYLVVQREGNDARFQPAKDPEELRARESEIRTALQARGVLPLP